MEDQLKPDEVVAPIPDVIARAIAADKAIADIRSRSFSERHPELGKMINCVVCGHRHRGAQCKPVYKQMWVDEDVETGELSIQYAQVPLPGQGHSRPWSIFGAPPRKNFSKPRKHRHPNRFGLRLVEITRELIPYVGKQYTEEASQMMEARRMAVNTISNIDERRAKRIRKQQDLSRRINRGLVQKGTRP